uniref:Uncharacterized protein n=1 Tax=Strongyloides papillosus TaxID=174720 RepID=A0A0N5C5T9_STREA
MYREIKTQLFVYLTTIPLKLSIMDKLAAGYYNAEETVNYWDGIPIKNIFGRTKQQLNFVKSWSWSVYQRKTFDFV